MEPSTVLAPAQSSTADRRPFGRSHEVHRYRHGLRRVCTRLDLWVGRRIGAGRSPAIDGRSIVRIEPSNRGWSACAHVCRLHRQERRHGLHPRVAYGPRSAGRRHMPGATIRNARPRRLHPVGPFTEPRHRAMIANSRTPSGSLRVKVRARPPARFTALVGIGVVISAIVMSNRSPIVPQSETLRSISPGINGLTIGDFLEWLRECYIPDLVYSGGVDEVSCSGWR